MMSVSEYANDVDKSIEYIFELCKKLNINANQEDDMLSDDDIILLDNEIENIAYFNNYVDRGRKRGRKF